MKNLEASALALVIDSPDLAPTLFENTTEKAFHEPQAKRVWSTLKELYDAKEPWSWAHLMDLATKETDLLYGDGGYLNEMTQALVLSPKDVKKETFLKYLRLIKQANAKKALLKEIHKEADQENPDLDEIERIVAESKIMVMDQEDPTHMVPYQEYINDLRHKRGGISTGYVSLDKKTDLLKRGELVAIMGRPTTGKTFICLNIFRHVLCAHPEERVAFFSLEMPKSGIAERLLQLEFNKSRWELKEELAVDESYESYYDRRFKNSLIFGMMYSAGEIAALIKKHGITVAFVDFLGLVKTEGERTSAYQETTDKITDFKIAAKEMNCTIIMMVQLNRTGGDGSVPVTLDMARDSGALEEKADFVYGLWMPSISEAADESWKDRICMKLLKSKRSSTLGIICRMDKNTGRIYEEGDEPNDPKD